MRRRDLSRLLDMPDQALDPIDDEDAEIATDDPCWEPDEMDDVEDDE